MKPSRGMGAMASTKKPLVRTPLEAQREKGLAPPSTADAFKKGGRITATKRKK